MSRRLAVVPSPEVDVLVAAARQRIDIHRARLQGRYGFTVLELEARTRPELRTLELRGLVLVSRITHAIVRDLESHLPSTWSIDASAVRALAPSRWHALPNGVTSLLDAHPVLSGRRRLTTQLLPEDGAIGVLVQHAGWRCVRAEDGTIGWTDVPLGPVAPPRARPTIGIDPRAVISTARSWVGVPYLLGGRTRAGIDCSALVQRSYRDALGVVLPRHSGDQLVLGAAAGHGPPAAGTLVFVWGRDEPRGHVGIRTAEGTIVHASTSRGRVVEDDSARFLQDAIATAHVPFRAALRGGLGHAARIPTEAGR